MDNPLVGRLLVLFCLGLLFSATVPAQHHEANVYPSLGERTKHSDLVIEGEVISSESAFTKDGTSIYTRNIVKPARIFKGEWADSLVTIFTLGGEVEDHFLLVTYAIELHEGQKGIFFCSMDREFINRKSGINGVRPIWEEGAFITYTGNSTGIKAFDKGEVYKSLDILEREIIRHTRTEPSEWAKRHEAARSGPCDLTSRTGREISFSFKNIHLSGDRLEFDIMAKANVNGTLFGKADIFLEYATGPFGTFAVQKGNVEISKETVISSPAYSVVKTDENNKTIRISVAANKNAENFSSLTIAEEKFCHVSMRISDFSQIGSVAFEEFKMSGKVFYYCEDAGFIPFDKINLSSPIKEVKPKSSEAVSLTYTIEHFTYNQSQDVVTFDIYAAASAPTYYSGAFVYIDFNPEAFPSAPVVNSTASFSRGDILASSSTYYTELTDLGTHTLLILVKNNNYDNPTSLYLLGSEPKFFGTVTMKVRDCTKKAGLEFWEENMQESSFYYAGSGPFPYLMYSPVIADDMEDNVICGCAPPKITSFIPDRIAAGMGEVLTIKGENFGAFKPSTSKLFFRDGDSGGNNWMKVHNRDFLWDGVNHWQDNQIQVIVPSTDENNGFRSPACTGEIRVETECGFDDSDDKLEIPYAVMNWREAGGKTKKIAIRETHPEGICFTFSKNVDQWIRNAFMEALNEWCAETQIAFFIDEYDSESNASDAFDGINLVVIEPVTTQNGKAALLISDTRKAPCDSGNGEYMTDIDIAIDPSGRKNHFKPSKIIFFTSWDMPTCSTIQKG